MMRNEDLMKILAAVGGALALIEAILGFNERNIDVTKIISSIITIVVAVIVLLSIISPGKPIPLSWILYVVLGIIMIVYSSLVGGILILIAGFVGYTER
jgi:hypothetical protein